MARKETKCQMALDTLRTEILSGKFASPNAFPSVTGVGRRFGISRLTAVKVFDKLKGEGLILSRPGSGTYVTKAGASRKIGLIVPGVASSEFFPPIVSEINRLARESGRTLLFGEVYSEDGNERLRQVRELAAEFIRAHVAGVIYQPIEGMPDARAANERILAAFRRANVPVVLIDSDVAPLPARSDFDVVGINDVEAGMNLAEHLLSVGARTIHFLLPPNGAAADANRYLGLLSALNARAGWKQRRKPLLVADPDDIAALRRHLRGGRPDAFICSNDRNAAVFCQTLEQVGISVPRDMLLAGFGDLQIARLMTPRLTTVSQSVCKLAQITFERLTERIANPAMLPLGIMLPAPLVVRASTEKGLAGRHVKKTTRKQKQHT